MPRYCRQRRLLPALFVVLALVGCSEDSAEKKPPLQTAGHTKTDVALPVGQGFDFYVLSLSWSPTWCDDNDPSGKIGQCKIGSNRGLIVHGLWPQDERGYPDFCPTRQSDRVPEALGRQYLDLIPSMGLIGHQWRKHGTCSGLSQQDYFAVTRAARERVALPAELGAARRENSLSVSAIEAAFVARNSGHDDKRRRCYLRGQAAGGNQDLLRQGAELPALPRSGSPGLPKRHRDTASSILGRYLANGCGSRSYVLKLRVAFRTRFRAVRAKVKDAR